VPNEHDSLVIFADGSGPSGWKAASDVAMYGDTVLAATIWEPAGLYILR